MTTNNQARNRVLNSYADTLHRVEGALVEAEDRSWQLLQEEIDKAVAFEQDAARLSKEEASLLAEWLRRDLADLVSFVRESGQGLREWLRFDLDLLEDRLRSSLLSIADQTQVDSFRLEQQLHHGEGTYVEGELALPGLLKCTACDRLVCLVAPTQLEACHHCGGQLFQRVTRRL